ncbi:MAG: mannose-1-phosphate guanylyltransferase [Phycisphaerales bacterium]|nr:mannose-1-phosphate guanylyltransferase [Phycisphaerales bacterium]
MRYALIMAGGAGSRLWPLSRRHRPKQWLRLFGGKSLLRQSYERAAAILPAEAIHVITSEALLDLTAEELPELPRENLIGEPMGRDTVNAIGLGAAVLVERDPEATIAVFTGDHVITPIDRFAHAVRSAFESIGEHPEALVTFGIRPTSPHTGYGYIARGERLRERVFRVHEFAEKPNIAVATKYVSSGLYYWNSGMFAWRADAILAQLKKHLPHSHDALRELGRCWNTPQRAEKLRLLYPTLMKISVDFAIMERADDVLVVEMDCNWVDVGAWTALESLMDSDPLGNVAACQHAITLGSRGNILVSEDEHLIATIGVDDLVIVHSPDATLICTKRDAQGIKELVDKLRKDFEGRFL